MTEAEAMLAYAETALARRNLAEATAALHAAEQFGAEPDHCSSRRWVAAMLAGDLRQAWEESDAIRSRNAPDTHRFWNGEKLAGKELIVRCLHGFGDAVQMLRFAPLLARHAAHVVFEVPPHLVPLARCLQGVDHVITWGDDAPVNPPAWDVQIEAMELPYLFRTALEDLPVATGYLQVPEADIARAALCMGRSSKPRIGIVWTGGEWNLDRSVPFATVTPLLDLPGIELWNLQGGPSRADAFGTPLHDATKICGDGLLALAGTIANLDLVITVDSLAAHLAGAMGKPVWVMLQHAADWRWMTGRLDSPWYPTMCLFRQSTPGDWHGVVAKIRERVAAHAW